MLESYDTEKVEKVCADRGLHRKRFKLPLLRMVQYKEDLEPVQKIVSLSNILSKFTAHHVLY